MRILALDYGTRRIGIAVSDDLKIIAQPLEFVPAQPFPDVVARLKQLIQEKEVELILVGMPRNMDGSYGPAAERVQEFVTELKKVLPLRIKKWDERLTTSQANRVLLQGDVGRQKRKQVIDKMAAAILLQGYLDALSSKEN
jgi:putative Holliday junction resolvase